MDHLTFTLDIPTLIALGGLLWRISHWASKVKQDVESIQTEAEKRNEEVDKKFDEVTASVKAIQGEIRQRNKEVDKKFDGVNERVDNLPSKLRVKAED